MCLELTGFIGWDVSVVRGAIARKRFEVVLERRRAAVLIQKYARRRSVCRKYQLTKARIVKVQSGTDLFSDISFCCETDVFIDSRASYCSVESQ